ncbi:MAG TPA: ABC transporter ATP-binding protein [Candidatus Latescibacteria bacterium]|nr:ABC transporter ATP-binding protein [Candidatus Latescibacterota bacterium]
MVSVQLEGVTKTFGNARAVDRVTLNIGRGELFFLLGPSGCGKTTLLRMIAGFYQADEGRILFDGRDMTGVPPHKRNTGMVFQNYALWPHLSVAENVAYGLDVRKVPVTQKHERVMRALEMVRMDSLAGRSPNQLSGGQQQRVALARALVIEPEAVLLDEPLSNLDAKLRLEMREEIRRIHDELGLTMIYVTHDQKEALSMADRLAVMNRGRIEQTGAPREVYVTPENVFVAGFIGETNLFPGTLLPGGSSDEDLQVDTSYGVLRVARKSSTAAPGRVSVSVRPEAISVRGTEEELSGGVLRGIVQSIIYLGDTEQYVVRLADGKPVRSVEANPARPRARTGQEVCLTFRSEDAIALPPDTSDGG